MCFPLSCALDLYSSCTAKHQSEACGQHSTYCDCTRTHQLEAPELHRPREAVRVPRLRNTSVWRRTILQYLYLKNTSLEGRDLQQPSGTARTRRRHHQETNRKHPRDHNDSRRPSHQENSSRRPRQETEHTKRDQQRSGRRRGHCQVLFSRDLAHSGPFPEILTGFRRIREHRRSSFPKILGDPGPARSCFAPNNRRRMLAHRSLWDLERHPEPFPPSTTAILAPSNAQHAPRHSGRRASETRGHGEPFCACRIATSKLPLMQKLHTVNTVSKKFQSATQQLANAAATSKLRQ